MGMDNECSAIQLCTCIINFYAWLQSIIVLWWWDDAERRHLSKFICVWGLQLKVLACKKTASENLILNKISKNRINFRVHTKAVLKERWSWNKNKLKFVLWRAVSYSRYQKHTSQHSTKSSKWRWNWKLSTYFSRIISRCLYVSHTTWECTKVCFQDLSFPLEVFPFLMSTLKDS